MLQRDDIIEIIVVNNVQCSSKVNVELISVPSTTFVKNKMDNQMKNGCVVGRFNMHCKQEYRNEKTPRFSLPGLTTEV
jgi:hypothetical protein